MPQSPNTLPPSQRRAWRDLRSRHPFTRDWRWEPWSENWIEISWLENSRPARICKRWVSDNGQIRYYQPPRELADAPEVMF